MSKRNVIYYTDEALPGVPPGRPKDTVITSVSTCVIQYRQTPFSETLDLDQDFLIYILNRSGSGIEIRVSTIVIPKDTKTHDFVMQ